MIMLYFLDDDGESNYDTNEIRNSELRMTNLGGRVLIETYFGLEVEYSARKWAVDLYVPSCYKNAMSGLCGNWNGDKEDDFKGLA